MGFAEYIDELRSYPPEVLIQPDIKDHRQAQDQKIKEDLDLAAGAVLQAEVLVGDGDDSPKEGDLVFVHVTIRPGNSDAHDDDILYSTKSEHGGVGQPLAFMIGKGARAPRAWEIALTSMKRGGIVALKVKPSYGYHHPSCQMAPPPAVMTQQVLGFELELTNWLPSSVVRAIDMQIGAGSNNTAGDSIVKRGGGCSYKKVLQEGDSWETARPPFQISYHACVRQLSQDGATQGGRVIVSTWNHADRVQSDGSQAEAAVDAISATMGSGKIPPGIEDSLGHMCKGERSIFILPAFSVVFPGASTDTATSSLWSELANNLDKATQQVEVELQLVSIVQVRDMTGTGEVMKRRLREGNGEFPIDCPLNDTTVRLHYRVRGITQGQPGPWLLDTRPNTPQAGTAGQQADQGAENSTRQSSSSQGVEIDTGCGEAPEALEMCAKLMVPGELASVTAHTARYAYEGRADAPQGLQGCDAVEWEVELLGFDKEGHWQVMSMEDRFAMAEKVKAKANALTKAGKHAFAVARYERILKLMESTRDWESQDEIQRMDALKLAVLLNLSLCCIATDEHAKAVHWCDKALRYDDGNAKAHFRRGRALSLKGDHDVAIADLKRAAELDPSLEAGVTKELEVNQRRAKAAAAKQKSQFKNFFDRT